jgi:hypothetical protein
MLIIKMIKGIREFPEGQIWRMDTDGAINNGEEKSGKKGQQLDRPRADGMGSISGLSQDVINGFAKISRLAGNAEQGRNQAGAIAIESTIFTARYYRNVWREIHISSRSVRKSEKDLGIVMQ